LFWLIWLVGTVLVVIQGVLSYFDGYFSRRQMLRRGVSNGWSFLEHGGMWADVVVISPLVAYVLSHYRLNWNTWYGIALALGAILISVFLGKMYAEAAKTTPEAHTHDRRTTPAGWVHGLFAVTGVWVMAMFFFTPLDPKVSPRDILIVAGILTPFFMLGVMKFSRRWRFERFARYQVLVLTLAVWIAAWVKIVLS
jgi:hypothetical protein